MHDEKATTLNPKAELVTDEEAILLAEFRKHKKQLQRIIDSGMLDLRGTWVAVHFDGDGNVRLIDRQVTERKTMMKW